MNLSPKILTLTLISLILLTNCNDSNVSEDEPETVSFLCCEPNPFLSDNSDNLDQTNGEISVFPYTTSNGDGYNDFFGVMNLELYPNNTVTIFDLNGTIVYSASDYYGQDYDLLFPNYNEILNGTIPIGTYKYKIVVENEQTFVEYGYFCLFANDTSFVTDLIECGGGFDPVVAD